MKLNNLLTSGVSVIALSTAVSALPTRPASATPTTTAAQIQSTESGHINARETDSHITLEDQTDQYLYNMSLESFNHLRNERVPSYFHWDSDGCSQSPDAPFGFPFLPACYRHDFGYDQYKKQGRFTAEGKDKLDRNFRADLYHQCATSDLQIDICQSCAEDPQRKDIDCKHRTDMCKFKAQDVCKCLGDIYYKAVQKFGGETVGKRMPIKLPLSSIKWPQVDVLSLGLCLGKNLQSADGKPVE